jgi:hypothetical protein
LAVVLAGAFAGFAAGMSDSSGDEGVIGRKALCLKLFHALMRRGRIVEQKKARSASGGALFTDKLW